MRALPMLRGLMAAIPLIVASQAIADDDEDQLESVLANWHTRLSKVRTIDAEITEAIADETTQGVRIRYLWPDKARIDWPGDATRVDSHEVLMSNGEFWSYSQSKRKLTVQEFPKIRDRAKFLRWHPLALVILSEDPKLIQQSYDVTLIGQDEDQITLSFDPKTHWLRMHISNLELTLDRNSMFPKSIAVEADSGDGRIEFKTFRTDVPVPESDFMPFDVPKNFDVTRHRMQINDDGSWVLR